MVTILKSAQKGGCDQTNKVLTFWFLISGAPWTKLDCSVARNRKCTPGRPKSVHIGQQNS